MVVRMSERRCLGWLEEDCRTPGASHIVLFRAQMRVGARCAIAVLASPGHGQDIESHRGLAISMGAGLYQPGSMLMFGFCLQSSAYN